uniref:Uncharacterized protein n=1 Tax=Mola mola TaxID=94237 RepID=A0A3Q3WUM5_MOLML
ISCFFVGRSGFSFAAHMSTMSVTVEPQQIDLTYITECIITILCPAGCPEHVYLQNLQDIIVMLQSKHGHNYMVRPGHKMEKRYDVLDTGWVDLLAPNLNQIFTVCSLMENWLQRHSKHVLVLHCRVKLHRPHTHTHKLLFILIL